MKRPMEQSDGPKTNQQLLIIQKKGMVKMVCSIFHLKREKYCT